uniref:CSON007159 protein n=1 Tax=Culicoides sonorensis TaxID=179676 RepID=A0A336LN73_CULSO
MSIKNVRNLPKPLKISRIAPPRTFINSTFIEDFANGQLLLTQNKVAFSEISFVLYYAPWCAESRSARKIYEVVAKVYGTRVFFSSINCWQPGGECRNQYSNVPKWPTIMSYRSTGFGLQYNGILSEHALLNFVNSIMYPLKRITNLDDLFSLMNDNSVVVLALLDMKKNQKHFKEFYQTSLKYLEVDPHREIRFAICTGDNSKVFGSKHQPKLRIYLWNETLEYSNFNWKTAALLKYIKNSVHQNQKWISPNKKSNSIASNIVKSSLILLFTPRSYTTGTFSFNNMMSHIGHIYQNCLNDKWVKELILQQLTKFRENQYYNTMKLDTYCKDYKNIQLNSTFNVSRDDRLPERLLEQDRNWKNYQDYHAKPINLLLRTKWFM